HEIEKSMSRFGSRFFMFKSQLKEMVDKRNFHIFERESDPVGSVWFGYKRDSQGLKMTVGGTRYVDYSVLPSIVEQVRNHAVSASKISWYTDSDVPVRHFFSDIHGPQSHQIGSMMMRVIDFEPYCRSIGIPADATENVVVKLEDDQCEWNNGVYKLIPSSGSLEVERCEAKPDVRLNAFGLSQIISGVTTPTQLHGFQELDCNRENAEKLEAIFPYDAFVSYLRF
ncbi:MAG: sterol carrier protein domain-containing protein, partial [Candidatus Thorarchaeota archaeon]